MKCAECLQLTWDRVSTQSASVPSQFADEVIAEVPQKQHPDAYAALRNLYFPTGGSVLHQAFMLLFSLVNSFGARGLLSMSTEPPNFRVHKVPIFSLGSRFGYLFKVLERQLSCEGEPNLLANWTIRKSFM